MEHCCPHCHGTGVIGTSYPLVCYVCGGTGQVSLEPLPKTADGYQGYNDDDDDEGC